MTMKKIYTKSTCPDEHWILNKNIIETYREFEAVLERVGVLEAVFERVGVLDGVRDGEREDERETDGVAEAL